MSNSSTITTNPEVLPKPTLEDPWAIVGGYNNKEEIRVTWDMPRAKHRFLRGVLPVRNGMSSILNTLLDKLITKCEQNGIKTIEQLEQFCEFVRDCRIEDGRGFDATIPATNSASTPGSTTNRPVSDSASPNVPARKARGVRKNTQP